MVSYNNEFQKGFNICGQPSSELVEFFKHHQKNTRLFLIWAVDKEGTPCLLPEEDIFCWAWMQLKPVSNKYWKPAVRENLIVNGIVADIIDFEADDVYDVVLIVRVLLILQSNKIRKSVLEKYSSAVCNDG